MNYNGDAGNTVYRVACQKQIVVLFAVNLL